ncbi:MAG: ferrous iron transporter B [Thermoanaerobaculia bacterium]|mgnify:CR=1 FL=1|nr:ferrous iron transporter B [Thermoanaerobaculia bacterium]
MSVAGPVSTTRAGANRSVPLRRLLLLGNPNTGKTTLFNRLCGMRAKTANFPGTTTDLRVGRLQLPLASGASEAFDVVDLPGLYSLKLDLPESTVAVRALAGSDGAKPAAAIVVADATNLSRHLMLVGELAREGVPFVVALNMIDLAHRRGLSFDLAKMSRAIGAPVIPIAARSGKGIDELLAALAPVCAADAARAPEPGRAAISATELELWAETVVGESVGGAHALGSGSDTLLDRIDETFTHPILGLVIFHLVMAGLFWAIFAVASVPMDMIEAIFSNLGGFLEARMPAGAVRDLLVGGLIGGVSGTVVFLPQICLLFFLITILEDTGYLARAAFVMDRLLCRFGLPGYAFVPLLSSHACAIPGILATRLIPDRHDRFATILVAPFMSCSARLPVYVLLTNFLFADRPLLAGVAFAGCYLLGALAAMSSAFLVRRTLLPGKSRPMVLELPTYKWPSLRVAFANAFEQGWSFLRTVGTVILAICFVMWWLSAYPKVEPPAAAVALTAQAETLAATEPNAAERLAAEAAGLTLSHQQEASFAGKLGRAVEPLFAPLGYDWRLTMGVLTAFAAREVFVSTLAVLVGAPDEEDAGILDRIHRAKRDDGTPLLTTATAVSLLVFFVLAMQCLATVVTVRREMKSWKWAMLQFCWMTGVAWIGAFVAFHGLRLAGVS